MQVERELLKQLEHATENHIPPTTVLITNGFCPDLFLSATPRRSGERTVICFQTSQGLFVSPVLQDHELCTRCLVLRWRSNSGEWEQASDLQQHFSAARGLDTPFFTVVGMAAALLLHQISSTSARSSFFVHLGTCEVSVGELLPIHGCEACGGRDFHRSCP